jgi:hypothetical protein
MVIWQDVPVVIIHKIWHRQKLKKRSHRNFTKDYGDIPVGSFNEITMKWEYVVNTRGIAYATRNRLRFRKNKKRG